MDVLGEEEAGTIEYRTSDDGEGVDKFETNDLYQQDSRQENEVYQQDSRLDDVYPDNSR